MSIYNGSMHSKARPNRIALMGTLMTLISIKIDKKILHRPRLVRTIRSYKIFEGDFGDLPGGATSH
jgi:hypothetical protein